MSSRSLRIEKPPRGAVVAPLLRPLLPAAAEHPMAQPDPLVRGPREAVHGPAEGAASPEGVARHGPEVVGQVLTHHWILVRRQRPRSAKTMYSRKSGRQDRQ